MATRAYMRRPPDYWWDFRHYPNGAMTIILETDDPRAVNGIVKETEPLPDGDCTAAIERIEADIADLRAGRAALTRDT